MTFLLVFVAAAALDAVWSRYTLAVTARYAPAAASWAAIIIVLGGFNITQYAHDWRTIFPAAAGAFLGTWLAVRK